MFHPGVTHTIVFISNFYRTPRNSQHNSHNSVKKLCMP